jgi:hypothetical protein
MIGRARQRMPAFDSWQQIVRQFGVCGLELGDEPLPLCVADLSALWTIAAHADDREQRRV